MSAGTLEYRRNLQGNGHVDTAAIAADPDGNVWVVTNTTAFDLPVKNAIQPRNPASSIIVSEDAGRTWSPLGFIPDLPFSGVRSPTVHPRDSNILIASGVYGVYRSSDSGLTWSRVVDLNMRADRERIGYVDQVAFDPRNPTIVYVAASGGVLKSADTGVTWILLTSGLGAGNCCTGSGIAVDPFQTQRLAYTINERAYASNNGGASWTRVAVPAGVLRPFIRIDPFIPGLWYLYSYEGVWRSTDAGATWVRLPVTTRLFGDLVLDPSSAGVLYATTPEALLRSVDHGSKWTSITPAAGYVSTLAVQPGAPNVLIASVVVGDNPSRYLAFRSEDSGRTWMPLTLSRYIDGFQFDPQRPNRLYAAGSPTSKVHVMKLDPKGELLFATYLGGQGDDVATQIAIGVDGSAYIAGTTSSPDFTEHPARLYPGLLPEGFAVRIDAAGRLRYATLFEWSGVRDLAVGHDGVLHILASAALSGLAADGSTLVYSASLERGYGQAVAIGSGGDVWLSGLIGAGTGTLMRFSPSGVLLSTALLPVIPAKIRITADGSVHIAATASTGLPRPVSERAFQSSINIDCPNNSGGTFPRPSIQRPPYMTDVYLAKVDLTNHSFQVGSYLGGTCRDTLTDFQVSRQGDLYIAGMTYSDPFPVVNPISGPAPPEQQKPFVSYLNSAASKLLFSTYLDWGSEPRIAVDEDGAIYVLQNVASSYSTLRRAQLLKLTPSDPAPLQIRNVTDAFQRQNVPISPLEIVLVSVPGLNPEQEIDLGFAPGSPLPFELAGVAVRFNGMPAQIISVWRDEIVCITPAGLKGLSHVAVQVQRGGEFSNEFHAEVRDVRPAFVKQVRNEDGSWNSPENPARVGSLVSFFLTGAGVPESDAAPMWLPLQMDFSGTRIPMPPAQALPGHVPGFYEVGVRVPSSVGTFPVRVFQAEGYEPWYPYVTSEIPISVTSGTTSNRPRRRLR
jgi:uncharacterized protein (TIGR03437 family)